MYVTHPFTIIILVFPSFNLEEVGDLRPIVEKYNCKKEMTETYSYLYGVKIYF